MKVFLDSRMSNKPKAKIFQMLNELSLRDANYSGIDFEIELDDMTWVHSSDELKGNEVLRMINRLIEEDKREEEEEEASWRRT